MSKDRVSWETYFMNIAREVATRSTCDRKHVGAVIVRDKTILSTGYNGSIKGLPHCDEAGHEMVEGHCVRTTHAEANAIVQAAKNGVKIDSASTPPIKYATAFITNSITPMEIDSPIQTILMLESNDIWELLIKGQIANEKPLK